MSNEVFIVHGHDESMKVSIARTIDKLDLNPIILHEKPSKGRTIIEKFTTYSNVGFAIILLSPDDIGYSKSTKPENFKYRARQNVILELGYFLGKLGRERVIALFKKDNEFEIPSDYSGVLFVEFDNNGKWKFDLVRELKAAGYKVDANKLI
ncbi:MAG: nucleotide-binding protein [Planctomycetia bacterium]|nr:nucleotide-binding protein [Planctomycetia bacterium]